MDYRAKEIPLIPGYSFDPLRIPKSDFKRKTSLDMKNGVCCVDPAPEAIGTTERFGASDFLQTRSLRPGLSHPSPRMGAPASQRSLRAASVGPAPSSRTPLPVTAVPLSSGGGTTERPMATATSLKRAPSPSPAMPSRSQILASSPENKQLALRFYGYFKESVLESTFMTTESYRVRRVIIYFYLEDDTIHVSEDAVENSGLPGGPLLKRAKIPKGVELGQQVFYSHDDLNVGAEVTFYGRTFRIVDCDGFTRTFLENMGKTVPPREDIPEDDFVKRQRATRPGPSQKTPEEMEARMMAGYMLKGRLTRPTPEELRLAKQYHENDRKVLRFFAAWDDRMTMAMRFFVVNYFLADETIEITEQKDRTAGLSLDMYPVFLRRQRLPKSFASIDELKRSKDYYVADDLRIGASLSVFGRSLLLYDCDEFTKSYLRAEYGVSDFTPIAVHVPVKILPKMEVPPHNGFGSEEDTLTNVKHLIARPPRYDIRKWAENEHIQLRFGAELVSDVPEDRLRKFIVTFYAADDSISVFEPPQKNSGIVSGKFLQRQKVRTPDRTRYYGPQDFGIGKELIVSGHKFVLKEVDERTDALLKTEGGAASGGDVSTASLSAAELKRILTRLREAVNGRRLNLRDLFREVDTDRSGMIDFSEMRAMFRRHSIPLTDQEFATLMMRFDRDGNKLLDYCEFVHQIMGDTVAATTSFLASSSSRPSPPTPTDPSSASGGTEEKRVFALFKAKMTQRRLLFLEMVRKAADLTADGMVGDKEVRSVVNKHMDLNLTEPEMDALMRVFFKSTKRLPLRDVKRFVEIPTTTTAWGEKGR